MKLEYLSIQQLPGISPGFELTIFDPGINVISGPNAIGKSSIVRALRLLMATDKKDPVALSLSADFVNGNAYRVQRTGRQTLWSSENEQIDRPAFPESSQLHYYWLSMEDLLQSELKGADQELITALRTALTGGYELAKVRSECELDVRPHLGRPEGRRLTEARNDLHKVEIDYLQLQKDEVHRLPELVKGISAAKAAQEEKQALENALRLLERSAQRDRHRAELAGFPAFMKLLRGDEGDRLNELEQRREQLARQVEDAKYRHQAAARELADTGLEDPRPSREQRATIGELIPEARAALKQFKGRREALHAEKFLLQEQEQVLKGAFAGNENLNGPAIDVQSVAKAEMLAENRRNFEREIARLDDELKGLPEAPNDDELEKVAEGASTLAAWLAADGSGWQHIAAGLTVALFGALAALLTAGWRLARSTIAEGALLLDAISALGILAALTTVIGILWAGGQSRARGRSAARRRFEALGLPPPDEWRRESIVAHRSTLQAQHSRLSAARLAAAKAADLEAQRQAARGQLADIERRMREFVESYGFDPSLVGQGTALAVSSLKEYRRLSAACQDINRQGEEAKEKVEKNLGGLRRHLSEFGVQLDLSGFAAEELLGPLTAAATALLDRCERADEKQRNRDHVAGEIERAKQASEETESAIAHVYDDLGIERGARAALNNALEKRPDWRDLQESLRTDEVLVQELRESLRDQPALLDLVDAKNRSELGERASAAAEKADQRDALIREHSQLEQSLQSAGSDEKLASAFSRIQAAEDALTDCRAKAVAAAAGAFLLDEVEREHRTVSEPAVLSLAREQFKAFTHYAWDLDLQVSEKASSELIALDLNQRRERRSLSELSSGTRMQLLLAVRLAWIQLNERGRESLPLFLDEALTTTDEGRFRTIAASLEQLAASGRQIFYLTARHHEAALWQQLTGNPPHHIELDAVRNIPPEEGVAPFAIPEQRRIPEPSSTDAAAYSITLGVAPFTPQQGLGGMHPFHILRDELEQLHRLLDQWRVDSISSLESLLQHPNGSAAIPDSEMRARIATRIRAASEWIDAWTIGRGQVVDRTVLEASGAVSDNFIDRVSEVAERNHGIGRALLSDLRAGAVERFRRNRIGALEDWLLENSYIDDDIPLSLEEIGQRVRMRCGSEDIVEVNNVLSWLASAYNTIEQ